MKITKETIDHLADLAKLEFNEKEKENIKNDMEKILDFVNKIEELNTEDVAPLIHVNTEINVLRKDDVVESISQKEALKNAPNKDSDYFKIPKVLDKN
mgnify:FL=1